MGIVDRLPYRTGKVSPRFIWLLGSLFFFLEYIARVAPSVMVQELMAALNTSALGLGSLGAFFYYAYLGMQLPVGVTVDRFGPHKLLTVMALLAAISTYMFAHADTLWMACTARFLIGFSTSFAFVGTLKLASVWFPPERFALLAGATQAVGMFGAAAGQGPMAFFSNLVGWRTAIVYIALAFLVLAVLIALFVCDKGPYCNRKEIIAEEAPLLEGLKVVFSNPLSWLLAAYAGLIYAPTTALAELWGDAYLEGVFHVSRQQSALAASIIFLGWGLGAPLMGYVSDRLNNRRLIMVISGAFGCVILTLLLVLPSINSGLLDILMFIYGLTNTGLIIAYAASAEVTSRRYTGAALAVANIASVIIGVILQPLIGAILDWTWAGQVDAQGVHIFTPWGYRVSMVLLPVCHAMAIVVAWFGLKRLDKARAEVRQAAGG